MHLALLRCESNSSRKLFAFCPNWTASPLCFYFCCCTEKSAWTALLSLNFKMKILRKIQICWTLFARVIAKNMIAEWRGQLSKNINPHFCVSVCLSINRRRPRLSECLFKKLARSQERIMRRLIIASTGNGLSPKGLAAAKQQRKLMSCPSISNNWLSLQ